MKSRLKFEIAVRVAADILILTASLTYATVLHEAVLHFDTNDIVLDTVATLMSNGWLLSLIGCSVFAVNGFYTKGRAYTSKYKVLVVLNASALTFLIFGFITRVAPIRPQVSLPALLFAFLFATLLLVLARLWARIWASVVVRERLDKRANSESKAHPHNILLIGGAGYIGSALIPKLLEKNYFVRVLDSFIYGKEPISAYIGHPNLELFQADFRQVDAVVRAMKDMDAVIHLGAIVGDPACALDEDLTVEVNVVATRTIAEVAKAVGISKFIFASTCSVYGASDLVLDERSSLNPVSLYARSKIASEKVLVSLKDSRFRPVILRFGTIYGLSGRTRFDLVVNLLAAKAVTEGKITVFGTDQWRPFLHVDDAARSVLLALEAKPELLTPTIFNVGSDEQNYTLGEVGRIVKEMVPSAELICNDVNVDRRNYRVNCDRIRKHLGFKPKWKLRDGIQQVLDSLESGRVRDYKEPRYSNIKFLSEDVAIEELRKRTDWARRLIYEIPEANGAFEEVAGKSVLVQ